MNKVACVGIAVQDRIYNVMQLPSEGGKYIAHHYHEVGGGPAATAAVAVTRLGLPCDFIGRLGGDDVGASLLKELSEESVGTNYVKMFTGGRSTQSAVLVDSQGERIIINHPSPDLAPDTDWMEHIDFSQYGVLLADVRWHEGAVEAFKQATKYGIPTVLDADLTNQDITELVAMADHAVFSQPGLKKFSGSDNYLEGLLKAKEVCRGRVYVTLGSAGCDWLEDGELRHFPAFSVETVDTTGAGDVFHGAFAVAVARGLDTRATVEFASAVAALKCTRPGGRAGIPDSSLVEEFINKSA
ncbi:PfkB family carbohydrate kinase [Citrobacter sp. Awk 4]|uniref:PfkB family carbohydrate kinase n=1 Tax=Citrobacter sp. Awk 4 TaxID=2963955 RepID=UPI002302C860|nr:PfkB family carbohydrate kinase [Citrobacter sp. Awk 4]MDA8479981.1 PfkB family carbohydrate kinase [Citrobacter sp. Awk 4]